MTNSDRVKFNEIMISCFSIFREEPNKQTVDLYFRLLEEYSIDVLSKAFTIVLKTSKFFPKPADIIEAICGNSKHRAELAFEMCWNAISEVHGHSSIRFSDPIAMEVIYRMGGWSKWCEVLTSEKKDKYFEFVRMYNIYESKFNENMIEAIDHLGGIFEYHSDGRYEIVSVSQKGICSKKDCLIEMKQNFGVDLELIEQNKKLALSIGFEKADTKPEDLISISQKKYINSFSDEEDEEFEDDCLYQEISEEEFDAIENEKIERKKEIEYNHKQEQINAQEEFEREQIAFQNFTN